MAKGSGGLIVAGLLAGAAYYFKDSWLPQTELALGLGTGATGNNPALPTTSTANQPISAAVPGAVPLGNQGCYQYVNGTDGTVVTNCPPGVSPPATVINNSCANGFTLDAGGICTKYPDNILLAQLNTIPWTGLSDIPAEQIARIDPQILQQYSTTTGVTAGTALAYLLGLGGPAPDGTMMPGSDGFIYQMLGGIYYKQGTATHATVNGIRLGAITAALPITQDMLVRASADPAAAALVGRDQRAMLSASQWNSYYTQATGIYQGIQLHPRDYRGALMSAEQYQARRAAAGLQTGLGRVGTLRPAHRGAFPLGGLHAINQWVPPGNRTIYQIPGRGAVPAGRNGQIMPRRMGLIEDGGGNHRWARSPFPRPVWWREAE